MTDTEKIQFVNDLIESTRLDILARVPLMPEDWDGIELRRFIADRFADANYVPMPRKRLRSYRNVVLTQNL